MAFKQCLKHYPPRGYIKLLDRNGRPVSSLNVDRINHIIIIIHNDRKFILKIDTKKGFNCWLSSFSALGVNITYNNQLIDERIDDIDMNDMNDNIQKEEEAEREKDEEEEASDEFIKKDAMNYDEEDERLLNESKRLEQLLKEDQTKILQSFQDLKNDISYI